MYYKVGHKTRNTKSYEMNKKPTKEVMKIVSDAKSKVYNDIIKDMYEGAVMSENYLP